VTAEGKKIKKQDNKAHHKSADVAERLNYDEARRQEDKWSV
jgi:hypothetical protein